MLAQTLMVLGAIAALGVGVWLGLPGRYTQSADDIEDIMAAGGARPRKARRVFTPLAWMQRKADPRGSRRPRKGRAGSGFRMETPDDR